MLEPWSLFLLGLIVIQLVREYRTRKSLLKVIRLMTGLIEVQTEVSKRLQDVILEKMPHLRAAVDEEMERWKKENNLL